jgi:hypothetical protein
MNIAEELHSYYDPPNDATLIKGIDFGHILLTKLNKFNDEFNRRMK